MDFLKKFYADFCEYKDGMKQMKKYKNRCDTPIQKRLKDIYAEQHSEKKGFEWLAFSDFKKHRMEDLTFEHLTYEDLNQIPERYASFMINTKQRVSKYPYAVLDGKWYKVGMGADDYVLVKIKGEGSKLIIAGLINPELDLRLGTGW